MSGSHVGMLWFDNDPKIDVQEKIAKARSYYARKFCMCPTWVEVNPAQIRGEESQRISDELKIAVRVSHKVMPNHFWLGEGE